MIRLITGGSGSGKSIFTEKKIIEERDTLCAHGISAELYYVATMNTEGFVAQKRIEKHRKQRDGQGFITIESMYLDDSDLDLLKTDRNKIVLLEDVSNLLANYMFSQNKSFKSADEIVTNLINLCSYAESTYIVTNEIFSDSISYDKYTSEYINALADVNKALANIADSFIEVVYGYPYIIK